MGSNVPPRIPLRTDHSIKGPEGAPAEEAQCVVGGGPAAQERSWIPVLVSHPQREMEAWEPVGHPTEAQQIPRRHHLAGPSSDGRQKRVAGSDRPAVIDGHHPVLHDDSGERDGASGYGPDRSSHLGVVVDPPMAPVPGTGCEAAHNVPVDRRETTAGRNGRHEEGKRNQQRHRGTVPRADGRF